MPWSLNDYPNAMKNLDDSVRKKAIDIANALLREEYDEGSAIAIAINTAKSSHQSTNQRFYHLVPHPHGWALRRPNADKSSFVFKTKEHALSHARKLSQSYELTLVIHDSEGKINRHVND